MLASAWHSVFRAWQLTTELRASHGAWSATSGAGRRAEGTGVDDTCTGLGDADNDRTGLVIEAKSEAEKAGSESAQRMIQGLHDSASLGGGSRS